MEDFEECSDEDFPPTFQLSSFTFPQVKPMYSLFRSRTTAATNENNNLRARKLRPLKHLFMTKSEESVQSGDHSKTDSAEINSISGNSLSGELVTYRFKEPHENVEEAKEEVPVTEQKSPRSNKSKMGVTTPMPCRPYFMQTPFKTPLSENCVKLVKRIPNYQVPCDTINEIEVVPSSKETNLDRQINEEQCEEGLHCSSSKSNDISGRILKNISNFDQNILPQKNSDLVKLMHDGKHSKPAYNGHIVVPHTTYQEEAKFRNVPVSISKESAKVHTLENNKNGNSCYSRLHNGNENDLEIEKAKPGGFNEEEIENRNAKRLNPSAQLNSLETEPSTLIVNGVKYSILSKLGQGGSSQVYQVLEKKKSSLLAVKCVNLTDADENTALGYLKEIEVLLKLQSSNRVIKLIDHEYLKHQQLLYVVMEKGDTDLSTLLKQMAKSGDVSLPMIIYYWTEMLQAVKEIHSHGIVHADLKPANFLLVCGRLKLIDFGIASSIQNDATSIIKNSMHGTCNYMSPEAIQDPGDSSRTKVGYKSDVWSLGCILYNLLYQKTPFQHITNSLKKLHMIADKNHRIDFPPIENCPPPLMDALKSCLTYDARRRPTVNELLAVNYIWPSN